MYQDCVYVYVCMYDVYMYVWILLSTNLDQLKKNIRTVHVCMWISFMYELKY